MKYNYKATLTDYANAAQGSGKIEPAIHRSVDDIAHYNRIGKGMTYNFTEGDMTHNKRAEAITV